MEAQSTSSHTGATSPARSVLLLQLQQSFDHRAWHGTNLWGSIRRIDAEEAAWRPHPSRHNVWELTLHAAYWKYRVFRLLTSEAPRAFDVAGSNFFPRPDGRGPEAWEEDRERLKQWHHRLLSAAETFPEDRLGERAGNDWYSYRDLILGAASHDVYHAGQIQLLKKLRQEASAAEAR